MGAETDACLAEKMPTMGAEGTATAIGYITAPSEVAENIARALVEKRLAACVNLVPGIKSIYRWEGAVEEADEVLLIIKTASDRIEDLKNALPSLHPYTVPELILVEINAGLKPYLDWINKETV
jgi:periplasmic divalent cation tolerance protein